jgi:Tol biopolymer transport system component
VFVAGINGRHLRFLRGSRSSGSPSWSPDGKHIAMLRIGRESSEVVVKRSDGRRFSVGFDGGSTEEEGLGTTVGSPGWGTRPR